MSTYTVVKSEKKKDVKDGAIVQLLTLKNDKGVEKDGVTMFIPAGQTAPVVGAPLDGTVEFDESFKEWKFKSARKGTYNGRSGAPRDFKADPVKNAAIAAEASQKVAVDTIRLAIETKQDPAELARKVVEVSRILYADITAAMNEAK